MRYAYINVLEIMPLHEKKLELSINPYTNHVFFPSQYYILGVVVLETLLTCGALVRLPWWVPCKSDTLPEYRSHFGRVSEGNSGI